MLCLGDELNDLDNHNCWYEVVLLAILA
jgi:hypothetical protein